MKKVINIIAVLILLSGLFFLSRPYGRYYLREYKNKADFIEFDSVINEQDEVSQLYEAMESYNTVIAQNGQTDLSSGSDAISDTIVQITETFPSGMLGWIEIEKINVKMPIFYGINDDNLSRGAAIMEGTSFPIGGSGTNCVLAAHRLPGMLGDVEMLEEGDVIVLKNFHETLRYRIVKSIVIEPYDTEKVKIISDRDMITLLTCHPYWVNSHRLVVYAERFDDSAEEDPPQDESLPIQDNEPAASGKENPDPANIAVNKKPASDSDTLSEPSAGRELTPDDLPDGEEFTPSASTIKTEDILRKSLIAASLVFIVFLLLSIHRKN